MPYVARRYRQPVPVADSTTLITEPAASPFSPRRSRPYSIRRRCRCTQTSSSFPQPPVLVNISDNEPSHQIPPPPSLSVPRIDLSQPSSPPPPPLNPLNAAPVPATAEPGHEEDVRCSGYESDVEKILELLN